MVQKGESSDRLDCLNSISVVSFLFVRSLAIIYFLAFLSIAWQVRGLYGTDGISPVASLLGAPVSASNLDPSMFFSYPTIFWFWNADWFLEAVPIFACLICLFVFCGIFEAPFLFLLWFLYLSIVTVGQAFMSFQWDILLLESGILAVFLASWRPFAGFWALIFKEQTRLPVWVVDSVKPSLIVIWLFRLLLFRLMFLSGIVKILSFDSSWRNLTAMQYHYETQPLPTPAAFFAQQLPVWFESFSCAAVLFIELFVPLTILFSCKKRVGAMTAAVLVFLQLLIMLTGNYCFFNLLTIALCLFLLDDSLFKKALNNGIQDRLGTKLESARRLRLRLIVLLPLCLLIALLNLPIFFQSVPGPVLELSRNLAPFRLVNSYGLFAVMTTERPEIIIEGSNDGKHWLAYEFRYKVGALDRPPPVVAPHQPRLDWQMWFAALGNVEDNPWLVRFCLKLLEGSSSIDKLLLTNPFSDSGKPPRFIRAVVYDYRFNHPLALVKTGHWWTRRYRKIYMPAFCLD